MGAVRARAKLGPILRKKSKKTGINSLGFLKYFARSSAVVQTSECKFSYVNIASI